MLALRLHFRFDSVKRVANSRVCPAVQQAAQGGEAELFLPAFATFIGM